MTLLGVNIDHIATIRQQRFTPYPDICEAAKIALDNGADSITVHLREDRRHIQDQDVKDLSQFVPRLNLEMAFRDEMVDLALLIRPQYCCVVPEKRAELTTEGGLNVVNKISDLQTLNQKLQDQNISLSLFIDPEEDQLKAAAHQNGGEMASGFSLRPPQQ